MTIRLVLFMALFSPKLLAIDCDGDLWDEELGVDADDCNGNGLPDACDLARRFVVPRTLFDAGDLQGLLAVDLDQDGDLDVAATGWRDHAYLLFNDGDARFPRFQEHKIPFPVPLIMAGDMEPDGDLDLFFQTSNGSGVLHLRNQGSALFLPSPEMLLSGRFAFSLGAVDRDRDLDLVAGDRFPDPGELAAFLQAGVGNFWLPRILGPRISTRSIVLADLNQDGSNDLALTTPFKVVVLLNPRRLPFPLSADYAIGSDPVSMAAGDVDGDGDLDLVTVNALPADPALPSNISILKNTGDGTFTSARNFSASLEALLLKLGDLDGDLDLDVIGSTSRESGITALWNDGAGAFDDEEKWPLPFPVISLDLADVDGDHDLDVTACAGSEQHAHAFFLSNLGNGKLSSSRHDALNGNIVALAPGDFDGDGDIDLATAESLPEERGRLRLVTNESGRLSAKEAYSIPQRPIRLLAADLDADQDLDLAAVVGSNGFSLLSNEGTNGFGPPVFLGLYHGPDGLAADLDGDGLPDLATINLNFIAVLYNRGGMRFNGERKYFLADDLHDLRSIAAADLDRDGKLDLIAAGERIVGPGTVSISRNLGGREFSTSLTPVTQRGESDVEPGDLDGDGNLDLAVSDRGGRALFILRGRGDATFTAPVRYELPLGPKVLVLSDLDADGDLDVAVAFGVLDEVNLLFNTGNGSFNSVVRRSVGRFASDLAALDLDGDEDQDLAIAEGSGLSFLENTTESANRDCNGNGIQDSCDIERGVLFDLDGDGLADDCVRPILLRGDADGNGVVNLADAIRILLGLFVREDALSCLSSADTNDDSWLDLTDAIVVLRFLFMAGPQPAAPFPGCGTDPTLDDLICRTPRKCP